MSNDPDYIRNEIDEIQHRMEARASYISDQLSPNRLAQTATNKIVADPMRSLESVSRLAQQHPIASALIGAGAASLMASISKPYVDPNDRLGDALESAKAAASDAVGTVDKLSAKAKSAAQKTASKASEQASKLEAKARMEAKDKAANVKSSTSNAMDTATSFAKENPIALGLLGLAAGALTASIFTMNPPSNKDEGEDERKEQKPGSEPETENRAPVTQKAAAKTTVKPARKTKAKKRAPKAVVADMNGPAKLQASSKEKSKNRSAHHNE